MDTENNELPQEVFDDWALVELFGHNKIAGKVKTVSMLGSPFIRVDVPETNEQPAYTRFYNPKSVYSLSPITEVLAKAIAKDCYSAPVTAYDATRLLTNRNPVEAEEPPDEP